MSGTSTSTGPGTRSGRGPARVATALAVGVPVLAHLAVLRVQARSSTGDRLSFVRGERRGVTRRQPLSRLPMATTQARSDAVRGRWTDVRATVTDRAERLGGARVAR